nr:methyltransferase domain-containing protein [Acanthopleuribacter pedis]
MLRDLKVLYSLALAPVKGKTHAERMEGFYGRQADQYDDFRKRLLKGRAELYQAIEAPEQGIWIDFGGGTGSNLEFLGDRIHRLKHVYLVDLAESLLKVAERRAEDRGWHNFEAVYADATTYRPEASPLVDVVTFSYSLTMIPNWFAAIDHAYRILKPGGVIGVVDFYVSRKSPDEGLRRHPWSTRSFWRSWFDFDHVFPNPDHLPYLHHRFEAQNLDECRAKVPYLPLVRAPYYVFVGRKPLDNQANQAPPPVQV